MNLLTLPLKIRKKNRATQSGATKLGPHNFPGPALIKTSFKLNTNQVNNTFLTKSVNTGY